MQKLLFVMREISGHDLRFLPHDSRLTTHDS
jgi:hypothetical protein